MIIVSKDEYVLNNQRNGISGRQDKDFLELLR